MNEPTKKFDEWKKSNFARFVPPCKVEVEIPSGKYCNPFDDPECLLHQFADCAYLDEDLARDGSYYLKHPHCPSLKKHTPMWIKKEKE